MKKKIIALLAISAMVFFAIDCKDKKTEAPESATAAATTDSDAGKTVYEGKGTCATCHGVDGQVAEAMKALPTPPRNFVSGTFKNGSSQAEVEKTINDGIAGTTMAAFKGRLTPEEISAVATYVLSFKK